MNKRAPRERHNERLEGIGIWDYTNEEDSGRTYPIGYCCAWVEHKNITDPDAREYYNLRRRHKDKYHIAGHKSAEEAAACYKQYLIDNEIMVADYEPEAPCNECGKDTIKLLYVNNWPTFRLCEKHLIGPFLEKNLKIATVVYESVV